jgi:hypothetical protein
VRGKAETLCMQATLLGRRIDFMSAMRKIMRLQGNSQ